MNLKEITTEEINEWLQEVGCSADDYGSLDAFSKQTGLAYTTIQSWRLGKTIPRPHFRYTMTAISQGLKPWTAKKKCSHGDG